MKKRSIIDLLHSTLRREQLLTKKMVNLDNHVEELKTKEGTLTTLCVQSISDIRELMSQV